MLISPFKMVLLNWALLPLQALLKSLLLCFLHPLSILIIKILY